ncbi:hypothetical protein N7540_008729 [Penicillium herquei]|nr:hypothetical protein N7540_008729 [Penicillium herquei]
MPSNVSLYEHSTFQPFRVEYHGKYDIAKVQFMITLLDEEKVRLLLQNLKMILTIWITLNCDMVKPEGYEPVAWDELHFQQIQRPIWMQTCLMGMIQVIAGLAQSMEEADRAKREGLGHLMVGWEQEYEQGAYVDMPYFLVARKPIESTSICTKTGYFIDISLIRLDEKGEEP